MPRTQKSPEIPGEDARDGRDSDIPGTEHLDRKHTGEYILPETKDRPMERLSHEEKGEMALKFFKTSKVINLDGEFLHINDMKPETETGRPVVFVPGFYAEGDSFLQPMLDTYLMGRRVITYNGYHGIDPDLNGFSERYKVKLQALQDADPRIDIKPQVRKAAALIGMVEELGLENVDVVAHSEGAIVTTMAAFLRPDLFATKALLNPAGMIGRPWGGIFGIFAGKTMDDVWMLKRRTDRNTWNIVRDVHAALSVVLPKWLLGGEADPKEPYYPFRQVSKRYGGNIREEYAAGDSLRLRAELNSLSLRRLDRWLPLIDHDNVVIGAGDEDLLFPPRLVFKHAKKGGVRELYELKGATHNVQHFEPAKMTQFIKQALRIPEDDDGEDAERNAA